MMKEIIYFFVILFIIGCKVNKLTQINTGGHLLAQNKLSVLSNYIDLQWDNTYNFRHERIKLPDDYKTLTWTNEIGESWMGDKIDTISIKHLIFEQMLISLINDRTNKITYNQVINYFGKPSNSNLLSDSKKYKNLGYYFNTINNPNCACRTKKNHVLWSNCRVIEFEFDRNGVLENINTLLFGP